MEKKKHAHKKRGMAFWPTSRSCRQRGRCQKGGAKTGTEFLFGVETPSACRPKVWRSMSNASKKVCNGTEEGSAKQFSNSRLLHCDKLWKSGSGLPSGLRFPCNGEGCTSKNVTFTRRGVISRAPRGYIRGRRAQVPKPGCALLRLFPGENRPS